MPVTTHRSTSADLARGLAVMALAVIQIVVAGLGGSGATGEDVGTVARSYPTPVLPAGWTFAIWGLIYLAFLGYAVYQLLPAQRTRAVHRTTGWWLAVSAMETCLAPIEKDTVRFFSPQMPSPKFTP